MKNAFLSLFLFISTIGYCQEQYLLTGEVFDTEGNPQLFGHVILKNKTDQSPIKYTYIENGMFAFDPQDKEDYLLEVNCLGFKKVIQTIQLLKDENVIIQLEEQSEELNEIQVTADRTAIINKNGNLKMDVANTNFANQPTPTALLSLFPKIIVEPNGNSLSVIGKGNPLLYLDNQRISIDQLNSINVNSIQSIELINNPSAKYEAEGRAVVLITRKKGFGDGVRITISENASWQRNFNNYAGVNGSLKKRKLELRSNFAYNQIGLWEGSNGDYQIFTNQTSADENSFSSVARPQFVVGGGFYYQLDEGDYFSGNVNLRTHTSEGPVISSANTYSNNILTDAIETIGDGFENRSFLSSNLNYNNKFPKSNSNVFVGLQYSKYIRNLDSEIKNNYNDTQFDIYQTRDQDFQINAYAARFDFEKKLNKNIKWEIGANFAQAKADAFSEFIFLIPIDTTTISNYDYSEKNMAFYSQFSGKYKKLEYSFGLRSESTDVEGGFQNADMLTVDRERTILFPRLMLNIPLDSSLDLTLNYAKSIVRPNYLNSSSISTYINPFLEYTRNVNLRSMVSEEVSANLQYKRNSIELSYVRQQDPTFVSIRFDEATERLISSPQNLDAQISWNLSITIPHSFKKWTTMNFIRGSLSKMEDESAVFQGVTPSLYLFSRHQFRLKKGITLGAAFWGITDRKTGIIDSKGFKIMDVFASKQFGKSLTVSVNLNDIFQNFEFGSTYEYNNVLTNEVRFGDRRAIAFNIRYSFGKEFKSKYQNKDIDDNLGRMK